MKYFVLLAGNGELPSWDELPADELAAWILEDRLPVRLQLQLHKFIWSPAARGV